MKCQGSGHPTPLGGGRSLRSLPHRDPATPLLCHLTPTPCAWAIYTTASFVHDGAMLLKIPNSPNWYMRVIVNGKQHQESTGTTNKREAQRIHDSWATEKRKGPSAAVVTVPTFTEYAPTFRAWIDTIEEDNTRAFYLGRLNTLEECGVFDECRLDTIAETDMATFKTWALGKGLSIATMNRTISALRRMCGLSAQKHKHLRPSIKNFPGEKGRERTLTVEEETAYLEAAKVYPLLFDVLTVLLDTAMRPSEVYNLRQEDIDPAECIIHIRDSKTEAGVRAVPCSEEVMAMLVGRAGNGSQWLFPAPRDASKPMTDSSIRKANVAARRAAKLLDANEDGEIAVLYSARHTVASRELHGGLSSRHLATMLGHTDPAFTLRRYTHSQDDEMIAAVRARRAKKG